jgi:hypothetical protein
MGDCGAYIDAVSERQAINPDVAARDRVFPRSPTLTRFHDDEPYLN